MKKTYKLNLNKFTVNVVLPIMLIAMIVATVIKLPDAIDAEFRRQDELYRIEREEHFKSVNEALDNYKLDMDYVNKREKEIKKENEGQ